MMLPKLDARPLDRQLGTLAGDRLKPRTRTLSSGVERGFTLIELIIVMLIITILLTVAIPNFDSMLSESKLDKARYSLATSLAFSRTEAVKRGEEVQLCVGTSDADCTNGVGATDWTDGWKVDVGGEVLRRDESQNQGVSISYSCGDFVTFSATGARTSSGTGECLFQVKNAGDALTKNLWVSNTGRVRMD